MNLRKIHETADLIELERLFVLSELKNHILFLVDAFRNCLIYMVFRDLIFRLNDETLMTKW